LSDIRKTDTTRLGFGFIHADHLPPAGDEYAMRNRQAGEAFDHCRPLKATEIRQLEALGNACDNWQSVSVTDPFDPETIRRCEFHGRVRVGKLSAGCLEHHDLRLPIGLTDSVIIACDIGEDVVLRNVRYLAHYIIAPRCILLNIDEMHTTDHAKFGVGIVKDGEDEATRIWLDLGNEAGGRATPAFVGMTAGDAYLATRFRGDETLTRRLLELTDATGDTARGYYGTVGEGSIIKHCRIIKDVAFGPGCYVKGANKLKNLTIDSRHDEPCQIGEGVELVNGIIHSGCKIFYGCKAVRFVMGPCSNLKYGARLIHSYLGDNSTVSCCELLNNLLFPGHEQHHNNSFLIAAMVGGLSNIAAGATIGSNHNSRANEGEISAGRGFWPGLCVSLKHNGRFASYSLLAKGDYPAEIDLPLPFALLSNDLANDRLILLPAYWWRYNMYALARNTWKIRNRDHRCRPVQHVVCDYLAPDTIEEIFTAIDLLERWTAQAALRANGQDPAETDDADLRRQGAALLAGPQGATQGLEVLAEEVENSRRPVVVRHPARAWRAYRQMVLYYAVTNLVAWMEQNPAACFADMARALDQPRVTRWLNAGGQIVSAADHALLREDIKAGRLGSWQDVHHHMDELWRAYPAAVQAHAFATLRDLHEADTLDRNTWKRALDSAAEIAELIALRTYESRKKDYDNPYRQMSYEDQADLEAVLGSAEDNSFVALQQDASEEIIGRIERCKKRP
jgi:hypothetical protein